MAHPLGARSRGRGRPFPKGRSPNPGGRPMGLGQYIRAQTRDGCTIADFMLQVMADPSRKLDQRMEAATWLADRGFGKPAPMLEHAGNPETPVPIVLRWGDMNADQEAGPGHGH